MTWLTISVAPFTPQRNELLDVSDVSETINSIREDVFKATIDAYIPPQSLEEMWDIRGCRNV